MARSSYYDDDNKAEARQIERQTEAEKVREAYRQQHDAMIDALPAGSLGLVDVYDPATPKTWLFAGEEAAATKNNHDVPLDVFAEEFLGHKPGDLVGLTNTEKRLLKEQSRLEIDGGFVGDSPVNRHYREGITAEGVQQQKKENREFEDAAAGLWAEYAFRHPEQAQDHAGARDAMKYLVANSGLSRGQLAALAKSDQRNEILDRIATVQYEMQWDSPRQGSQPYDPDENRTAGIGTGANGGGRSVRSVEEKKESIMAGIADWQKATGFHR